MNAYNTNQHKYVTKSLGVLGVLVVICCSFYGAYNWQHQKVIDLKQQATVLNTQLTDMKKQLDTLKNATTTTKYTSTKGIIVNVYTPEINIKQTSPIAVTGEIPGNWSFEGSFPVVLKNAEGVVVSQATAQVLGDWMTSELVPFSAKITYDKPLSGSGILVLQKDNPSGLAQNDDSVSIPIVFK